MNVLVTGGAGFIGTHTCVELLNSNHSILVIDNFENSHPEAVKRVETITGKKVNFKKGDIRDTAFIKKQITDFKCEAVMHFAGLKAVGESCQNPLKYYDYNVAGTLSLLQAMQSCNVKKLVFSSSATVYGNPKQLPITEDMELHTTNPYGRSKLIVEDILRDLYTSDPSWHIAILRYFNPVGAHKSSLIGEDPIGIPNNLMPIVAQVASKRREKLSIWGDDYPTKDGTGIRDYIHIVDLAIGHLKALENLNEAQCNAYNLGTGNGYSVLEVIKMFEHISNQKIEYEIAPRRDGDVAECYAEPLYAMQQLGWKAERGLREMCEDMWNWQVNNPKGY